MLIAHHVILINANSHQTTDHTLSRGRQYQLSKRNNITVTRKRLVILILVNKEGIDFTERCI